MNILYALLLGIVQGLTEFLPLSSSALTFLFQEQTAFSDAPAILMSCAVHLGTLAACLWILRRSFFRLFASCGDILKDAVHNLGVWYRNTRFGENGSYARIFGNASRTLAGMILCATIPGLAAGFLLRRAAAGGNNVLLICGTGFLFTAILLLVTALMPPALRSGKDLTMQRSFLIGILQGAAVLPGISRLGVVYSVSQILGMHRKTAARFAILSVLPVTLGALLYEFTIGVESIRLSGSMTAELITAAAAAALTGGMAVRAAGRILRKNCVRLFSAINALSGLICVVVYVIQ